MHVIVYMHTVSILMHSFMCLYMYFTSNLHVFLYVLYRQVAVTSKDYTPHSGTRKGWPSLHVDVHVVLTEWHIHMYIVHVHLCTCITYIHTCACRIFHSV